ncbi:MAG: hypothetical protein ACOZNI_16805, partial [Myxococcota bacterium]
FVSFVAGLTWLLPGAGSPVSRAGVPLATVGVVMLSLSAWMPGAEPVLANYVPVIDHPLFVAGLVVFSAGVLATLCDRRLLPLAEGGASVDPAAVPGLRAAGLGLVVAALTAVSSVLALPAGLDPTPRFEALHWGPGHVLQLVSETAMVSVWLMLLGAALGRPVLSRRVSAALFGLLLLPWLAAPLLPMTSPDLGRDAFTQLMRWGLFPVVSVFLVAGVVGVVRARASLADPRVAGFAVSAGLTALGFGLGAMIRGSNTIVPAHYHASIGAVTAAFMTVTPMLLDRVGVAPATGRLARAATWQPVIYGLGQMVFATGFAMAGSHGMARKAYGPEQAGRDLVETVGLGVMGAGGLVAVAGGLLFLWIVARRWTATRSGAQLPTWRSTWIQLPTQSSG